MKNVRTVKTVKSVRTVKGDRAVKSDRAENVTPEPRDIDSLASAAAHNPVDFERLLNDFKPFLKAQVSQQIGSWGAVDLFDEMLNDAYLAFYESVKAYDQEKGHFFPFMWSIVHKRLIDCLRKNRVHRIPTVPLETDDEDAPGLSSQVDAVSMEASRESDRKNDLVSEIECYKRELAEWGITMDAMVAHSPKHVRLKGLYREIIDAVADDDDIMRILFTQRYFPIKKISELTEIPPKIIERARIFIVGSLIIRAGDYEQLKEYVANPTPSGSVCRGGAMQL